MLLNKDKAELITNIFNSKQTPVSQNIILLINTLVEETRVDNDTADEDTVKRNQGGIAHLMILKDYILKGLPHNI